MNQNQGLDASDMRLSNNNLVLQLLWQHQTISRADLARLTGMSRPSISDIVAEHIELGLVSEVGHGTSNGGRRPVMLRFEDEAHLLAGLDIGATHVSLMLTNLRGQEVSWSARAVATRDEPDLAIEAAQELLSEGLACARRQKRKLIGLGVGISSPAYRQSAACALSVHPAIHPRWAGYQLGKILAQQVAVPIFIENDANLGALAEYWWTTQRNRRHLLYLKVASGVGAGVIIDGKIFSGAHGIAGELGHTFIAERQQGPELEPTAENLNRRIGAQHLLEKFKGKGQALGVQVGDRGQVFERGKILRRMHEAGEAPAVIDAFIQDLSIAIVNAMVSFDPAIVSLGGIVPDLGEELFTQLRRRIQSQLVWPELQMIPIQCSRFGEKQTALGAATLVLENMLNNLPLFCEGRDRRERSSIRELSLN